MNRVGRSILVVGVIGAGVAYYFMSGQWAPFTTTTQALAGYRVNGLVTANQVLVSAKIDGRIEKLTVDEGSVVKKGDLIAVIGLEEAASEKRDRQSTIEQLGVKLQRSEENVNLVRETYAGGLTRGQAQLQAAERDAHQAALELEQLKRDQERAEQLWHDGVIAKQDAERARSLVEVGEAKIKALEERVSIAKADLELLRSNERLISLATRDVDQTQSELRQANAHMDQLLTQIGYSKVLAPLTGVVSVRVSAQGEVVKAGTPIVSIVDLDDIWVKASFEERLASQVAVGQKLPVQLASGQEIRGEVVQIAPESEFATQRDINRTRRDIRTIGLRVKLNNPERRIHPGMTAFVFLEPSADKLPTRTAPASSQ